MLKAIIKIEVIDMMKSKVDLTTYGVNVVDPLEREIQEYVALQAKVKELEKLLAEKRKYIIERLGEGTYTIGDYKVSITTQVRRYLKTKDVKEFLARRGVLNDFLEEKEITVLSIRR